MHNLHNKTLKRVFQVEDDRTAKFSDEVILRVERAEKRMAKYAGHFLEMNVDTLVTLISDISDEEVFAVIAPDPDVEPQIDYKSKSKAELIMLCDKTDGIEISGTEKHPQLVEILEKHNKTEA